MVSPTCTHPSKDYIFVVGAEADIRLQLIVMLGKIGEVFRKDKLLRASSRMRIVIHDIIRILAKG